MSLGEERTTYVIQQSSQPIEVQLIRGTRGYRWIINVKAEKGEAALQMIQHLDNELRRRYGGEKTVETPAVTVPASAKISVDEVKRSIPQEILNLVNVEEADAFIKITPRQFLGSEVFGKINDAVRKLGGEYMSKGKDSHWIIAR